MLYDVICVDTYHSINEHRNRNTYQDEHVFWLVQSMDLSSVQCMEDIDHIHNRESNVCIGTLLEVHTEGEWIEVVILEPNYNLKYIHTQKVIFYTYESKEQNHIISLYEVLWASGVYIDSKTLQPITNDMRETSLKGLFYYGKERVS